MDGQEWIEDTVCHKRGYYSKAQAKKAHRHSNKGFRIRVYFCNICSLWHVANNDKKKKGFYRRPKKYSERREERNRIRSDELRNLV